MPDLVLDEQHVAWELRAAWLERRAVRLTLSERCTILTIVGKVRGVAVTGAFVTMEDGWAVPVVDIRGVGKPTLEDVEAYAKVMHDLREGHCDFCKGKPVQNAASLIDGKWRPPAECPRCGRTYESR